MAGRGKAHPHQTALVRIVIGKKGTKSSPNSTKFDFRERVDEEKHSVTARGFARSTKPLTCIHIDLADREEILGDPDM